MLRGVYKDLFLLGEDISADRVYVADFFNLVAEKLESNRERFIRRVQFDNVSADPEFASLEIKIIP